MRAILCGAATGLILGAVILVVMSECFDMNLASF